MPDTTAVDHHGMLRTMTAFTVYYSPSGDEVFPEGSTFKVQDNGVLTTTTAEGRRRINSPNAWHHVEVQASPPRPKQAAKTVGPDA